MKDPYEVLGVPRGSDREKVKVAYRELAKKYHPDQYVGSPLADLANEKMQEINEAYDTIMSGGARSSDSSGASFVNDYSAVENYIDKGYYDEAERILEEISSNVRDAHWYYLKGQINYKRGWTQQAYSYYSMAYNMQPGNPIYREAFERISQNGSGGFRTGHTQRHGHGGTGDCDGCDLCTGLMCADCCCECCGGDLISCC